MIASWMLYASLLGVFASLAAHALDRGLRANRIQARFVWAAAMLATLLAPVAGYMVRRASISSSPQVAIGAVTAGRPSIGVAQPSALDSFATNLAALREIAAKIDRPVLIAWAALTLLLLGRFAFATGMLWRNRRQWTAREIDGVPLWITPDLGPAVVALPRSEILVPEWLLSLDPAYISMVLRHEREHRIAGDPRLLVFARVITALVPWNPALWFQARRLRLAIEMDCDARVLRAETQVDRYGSLLLAIAQHPRTTVYAAATLTESTSDLERRIDAMTRKPPSTPRIVGAALGAVAIAAVFFACMTPAPDVVAGPSSSQVRSREVVPADSLREIPAKVDSGVAVAYPRQLQEARVGGVVVVKFVVDTNGRAEMKTLTVVKSDHDLFTAAVQRALPDMRFAVAEQADGKKSSRLVQMPFVFSNEDAAKRGLVEVPAVSVATASGVHEVPIGGAVRYEPLAKGVTEPAVKTVKPTMVYPTRLREVAVSISTKHDRSDSLMYEKMASFLAFDRFAKVVGPSSTSATVYTTATGTAAPVVTMKPGSVPSRLPGSENVTRKPASVSPASRDTIPPAAKEGNLPPAYPNQLRIARVEGEVTARFLVTSEGRVETATFEIVKSDHDLFALAVRNAIASFRFTPARINGKAVDWTITMPFVFSLSK